MTGMTLEGKHLIIRGNAQGSIAMTFGLIALIIIPFLWMFSFIVALISLFVGILLLLAGFIQKLRSRKQKAFEIKNDVIYIFPDGHENMRYEIPLSRVSYLTQKHRHKSGNTEILTLILNTSADACRWVNRDFEEILTKKEVDLEFLPVKEKFYPEFFKLLKENFQIHFVSPEKGIKAYLNGNYE